MKTWLNRKDSMIRTAIDIIDELGLQGLTAKELAKREGVAQSLIYNNFRGMDDVIAQTLDHYAHFDKAVAHSILEDTNSPREKISEFMRIHLEYYENYPALTSLVNSYESLVTHKSVQKNAEALIGDRIDFLEVLIDSAAREQGVTRSLEPRSAAIAVWGSVSQTIQLWRISSQSFALKDEVLRTIEGLVDMYLNTMDRR